jgi:hypothetical protein
MPNSPRYSFPKTKNKSFINSVQDHSKKVPAPSEYHKELGWLNKNASNLGKGAKRKTIIDEIFIEK